MTGPLISIRGLSRTFVSRSDTHRAVHDADLDVQPGEFFTLLGPSGSGKTTTLRMIAGLERPDRGTVSIEGRTVSCGERGLLVPPQQRGIGMVFQSYAVWPHLNVFENVAYPLRVARVPRAQLHARVGSALALVRMEGLAERRPSELSGGQQQRVALARALVGEPRILLLDEPFSGLDAELRIQLGEELTLIQEELGIAMIYVTHDRREAMRLSDTIAVLAGGVVEQVGSPLEVLLRPATRLVATFLADTTFVPVLRRRSGPGAMLHLVTAIGELVSTALTATDLPVGWPDGDDSDAWVVGIRTADVVLEQHDPDLNDPLEPPVEPLVASDNVLPGTVTRVRLRGATMDVGVRVGNFDLEARMSATAALRPGDDVRVRIPADRVIILR
jgi:iron(III) transport system ATP-binding protein